MAATIKDYDSWIDVYPINPPVGGEFGWGAKAKVKKTGTGRIDDFITLSEHLGRSQSEAQEKARQEAHSYIEARTND
jgi:hypothetical protein